MPARGVYMLSLGSEERLQGGTALSGTVGSARLRVGTPLAVRWPWWLHQEQMGLERRWVLARHMTGLGLKGEHRGEGGGASSPWSAHLYILSL